MALNPHILVWAREAAGLSVDEAAHATEQYTIFLTTRLE
jgi:hypothetical protein